MKCKKCGETMKIGRISGRKIWYCPECDKKITQNYWFEGEESIKENKEETRECPKCGGTMYIEIEGDYSVGEYPNIRYIDRMDFWVCEKCDYSEEYER